MSGEQPFEGGGYTEVDPEEPPYIEVQAGPPAHAPAPQISAVSTLHNPFFVTGLVGGDEQTPSSEPSSLPSLAFSSNLLMSCTTWLSSSVAGCSPSSVQITDVQRRLKDSPALECTTRCFALVMRHCSQRKSSRKTKKRTASSLSRRAKAIASRLSQVLRCLVITQAPAAQAVLVLLALAERRLPYSLAV